MEPTPKTEISLTVVMPAYNEEGLIENAVREIQRHVFQEVPRAQLIVVDDGSKDGTGAILDRLAEEDSRITIVHQENGGHGKALWRGLERVQSEFVFLIDSDLQIPLTVFKSLWEGAQGRDGAFGVRAQRHDPVIRLLLTRVIRCMIRWLFGLWITDANVPFKIVSMDAWRKARPLIPEDILAPSMFLAIFMYHSGMNIMEQDVPHEIRATSIGVVRQWRLFKLACSGFSQLVNFRKALRSVRKGG